MIQRNKREVGSGKMGSEEDIDAHYIDRSNAAPTTRKPAKFSFTGVIVADSI
jgi:hypothetical protein